MTTNANTRGSKKAVEELEEKERHLRARLDQLKSEVNGHQRILDDLPLAPYGNARRVSVTKEMKITRQLIEDFRRTHKKCLDELLSQLKRKHFSYIALLRRDPTNREYQQSLTDLRARLGRAGQNRSVSAR